ncbi:unnamed protein product [Linum tenue]|nr:unnamed protein product [Linum tenue]
MYVSLIVHQLIQYSRIESIFRVWYFKKPMFVQSQVVQN